MEELFKLAPCFPYVVMGHAAGFIMGAGLMYFLIRFLRKQLLEIPASRFTPEEMRFLHEQNLRTRELILATRHELDKISGSVP